MMGDDRMGLLSKLFGGKQKNEKILCETLVYARLRDGTPWEPMPKEGKVAAIMGNLDCDRQMRLIVQTGLVYMADGADRLRMCTIKELKDTATSFGIDLSGKTLKEDIVQAIAENEHCSEIVSSMPKMTALTEKGKSLLAQHDYIEDMIRAVRPYDTRGNYTYYGPRNFYELYNARIENPEKNKYQLMIDALDKESFWGDGCYDEEDKAHASMCKRYASFDYYDFKTEIFDHAKEAGIKINGARRPSKPKGYDESVDDDD